MFFIMGITERQKELDVNFGMVICPSCGAYGSYNIFVTYMCLTIFFIPVLRWGKKYFVKSTCCKSFFELNKEKGREAEKGNIITINPEDLTLAK